MLRRPMRATFAIPCYNAGPHLKPLLESLLAQTEQDFALLLVDDASTDDSVATARAIAGDRIVIHRNATRLGIAGNWNRCADLVATDAFCLAHMDDVYAPEYLRTLLARLEAEPEAGIVHCRTRVLDVDGRPIASDAERYKDGFWRTAARGDRGHRYRLLYRGNFVVCPSKLYRTAAFRAVGPFDPHMSFAMDWKLSLAMLRAGWDVVGVDEPLVAYRRHAGSATGAQRRSLNRYAEELAVLTEARAAGIAADLLRAHDPDSPALRRNVLYDAFHDLRHGEPEMARGKIEFLRDHAPREYRHPTTAMFRMLMRAGPLGRVAMSAGLAAAMLTTRR
jgi:GT2 family glycosyltransferase